MKNKYKLWRIASAVSIVIIISIGIILFQPKKSDNEQGKPSVTDIAKQPVIEQPTDNNNIEETDPPKIEQGDEESTNKLTLFTADADTYVKKEEGTIQVDESLSIEKKLTLIANELSKTQFENLPIEVQGIEEIDGKKIAIINLLEKEQSDEQGKNWIQYLNAGSTGSRMTLIVFEESFLQKDLAQEWIDGIKIIHEGENIEEMDHFPGTQIIYRIK